MWSAPSPQKRQTRERISQTLDTTECLAALNQGGGQKEGLAAGLVPERLISHREACGRQKGSHGRKEVQTQSCASFQSR